MSDITADTATEARPASVPARIHRVHSALPATIDRRAEFLGNPLSDRAGAFRILRHRIAERGDPRVLLVTSAGDGDGKTTCALNLALALCESGRYRVLLVEANTRRPALATMLNVDVSFCWLEQLAHHRQIPDAPWTAIEMHSLDLLLARDRGTPPAPMHGPTVTAALDSLRVAYDFVVVDTSAVLTGLDVPMLEDACDGIILCARARRSRGRSLRKALEHVTAEHVLGTVLVDV
jgi:Mrp family chromosome partitioning ATPase